MFPGHGNAKTRQRTNRGQRESGTAWTISCILHTVLFVLLACFVLPAQVNQFLLIVSSQQSDATPAFEFVEMQPASLDLESPGETTETLVDISAFSPERADMETVSLMLRPEYSKLDDADLRVELSPPARSSDRPRRPQMHRESRKPATTDSISTVNGVAEAFGPIQQAIRDEVTQGDTLVVWLMDASISLQLNRRLIAARLAEFQTSMGLANRQDGLRSRDQGHRLFNSVIAFGKNVVEIQGPSLTGLRAVDKMAHLPSDPSGVERTMHAVNRVVDLYRGKHHRRERMLIVLLTDESGDDGLAVESTIANCRHQGVAVHVIGPTAVMGLEEGSQLWTSPAYGQQYRFLLKVKRGPESCLPERAFLPYWHETRLSAWRPGVRPANSVPWYGGEYREGVLSGFGPYTLTRLALQTGGSYTLFDRGAGDRYRQQTLRRYFPLYGSLSEYQASIQDRPLRMFVAETAAVTLRESELFVPLQMMFFGARDVRYPFAPQSAYMHPAGFRRKLRSILNTEMLRAQRAAERINLLLSRHDPSQLEYEYAKEDSHRWKAWYELNRGRLLAAAVRYDEYIATCRFLLHKETPLGKEVNEVLLVPGLEYRVASSSSTAREAVKLLERCRDQHASTPWADLAAWELATGFGIKIQTKVIPPPPPPKIKMGLPGASLGLRSTGGGGGGHSFSFPSL